MSENMILMTTEPKMCYPPCPELLKAMVAIAEEPDYSKLCTCAPQMLTGQHKENWEAITNVLGS
jgi:hypothetical protein